jgi:hypothetical protein
MAQIVVSYNEEDKCIPVLEINHGDFELFQFQIMSLFSQLQSENYLLIDCYGREIKEINEIEDLIEEFIHPHHGTSFQEQPQQQQQQINLWIFDDKFHQNISTTCSSLIFPQEDICQSYAKIIDTPFEICSQCRPFFDQNLLAPVSLVALSGSSLHHFKCTSQQAIQFGLSLLSQLDQPLSDSNAWAQHHIQFNNPIGKFLRRKYLHAAIDLLPRYRNLLQPLPQESQFESRFQSYVSTVQAYENPLSQALARDAIDWEIVQQNLREYQEQATDTSSSSSPPPGDDVLFLKALVKWFKRSFFKWCNQPGCTTPSCDQNGKPPESLGMGQATDEERNVHWASRVEIYRCTKCQTILRFPRINNPRSLLETRRGRCGEWANCFGLICRSLSLDTRWVIDYTDHVWVEVWIDSLGRFVHIDPCEMALDTPLLYEAGWNKKLSFLFSFSRYGASDSTPRYSRKLNDKNSEMRERRGEVTERLVLELVKRTDAQLESQYLQQMNTMTLRRPLPHGASAVRMADYCQAALEGKAAIERLLFGGELPSSSHLCDISIETMRERKRKDRRELMKLEMMCEGEDALREEEKKGRQSGDRQWREQRGEIGGGENDKREQEGLVGDLKERYPWMAIQTDDRRLCLLSPFSRGIDIFVSSIAMTDPLDNSRNGFISNLNNLHCSEPEGGPSCGGGVFATHSIMVNGIGLCRAGRGHNVVILSLETGELIGSRSFDTHDSSCEGGLEMIQFLLPFVDPSAVSAPQERCRERFLILLCVIDSGEHLSDSAVQFLSHLANVSSARETSIPGSSPLLHSSFTASGTESRSHHPSHRQSYVLAAITCPSSPTQETLWSYSDMVPTGRGPLTCRMRLSFELESDRESNELLLQRKVGYHKLPQTADATFSLDHCLPITRHEISSDQLFQLSHESMCQLCEEWERERRALVTLVYRKEMEVSGEEKLYAYIYPFTSVTTTYHSAGAIVCPDPQEVYLKCLATPLTLPPPPHESASTAISVSATPAIPPIDFLKYVPLGGQHHPDTVSFDTTTGLLQMTDLLSCSLNEMNLTEVSFYGGDEIVLSLPPLMSLSLFQGILFAEFSALSPTPWAPRLLLSSMVPTKDQRTKTRKDALPSP